MPQLPNSEDEVPDHINNFLLEVISAMDVLYMISLDGGDLYVDWKDQARCRHAATLSAPNVWFIVIGGVLFVYDLNVFAGGGYPDLYPLFSACEI